MKQQQTLWQTTLKPVAVLLAVCLVAGLALAAVNAVTAPVIAAHEEAEARATYAALLPQADSFTTLPCPLDGVTTLLRADNGGGWIVVAAAKGYNGDVPAAVAFDNEGNLLKVVIMDNDETIGVGSKVGDEAFTGQFSGRAAQAIAAGEIDAVSNATYSSRAALAAVNLAIEAYQQAKEGLG